MIRPVGGNAGSSTIISADVSSMMASGSSRGQFKPEELSAFLSALATWQARPGGALPTLVEQRMLSSYEGAGGCVLSRAGLANGHLRPMELKTVALQV